MWEWYVKINRAKTEVAKEILEKVYELYEEKWLYEIEDFYNEITSYIEKEHLFQSDYTNNK